MDDFPEKFNLSPYSLLNRHANVDLLKLKYEKLIKTLLTYDQNEMYSNSMGCAIFSNLYLKILRRYNFKVKRICVDDVVATVVDGTMIKISPTHYFLIDDTFGQENEIIIDPTYLQLFDKIPENLKYKPIFVGTRKDLESLFVKYKDDILYNHFIRFPDRTFPNLHKINPETLVKATYGYLFPDIRQEDYTSTTHYLESDRTISKIYAYVTCA